MPEIIRLCGLASGETFDLNSRVLLKAYDPDGAEGRGAIETTADPAEALRFPEAGAAWLCWQQKSRALLRRPDGKINRPLTAFNIEIIDAQEGT